MKGYLGPSTVFVPVETKLPVGSPVMVKIIYGGSVIGLQGDGRISAPKPGGVEVEIEWNAESQNFVDKILDTNSGAPQPPTRSASGTYEMLQDDPSVSADLFVEEIPELAMHISIVKEDKPT